MQPPKTRDELVARILAIIDSDFVGSDDVEEMASKIEAQGVSFVPTGFLPPDFVNPYATKKG